MKLHEYQSKRIFAQYGVPIPQGDVATTPEQARQIAARLGKRVVVKSQVLVGGRGKAGGIRLADDPDEAEKVADQILGMKIKGLTVKKVLVDEAADIATEIYLGIVIDRAQRRPVMMASAEGGVEIEEVARATPERIVKIAIDPFLGLQPYQGRELAFGIGLPKDLVRDFVKIAQGLYEAFVELRCFAGRDQSPGRDRRAASSWPWTARCCWTTTPSSAILSWPRCAMPTRRRQRSRKPAAMA